LASGRVRIIPSFYMQQQQQLWWQDHNDNS
jgi:hypothetical protein